jgi:hypothetical protein
MKTRINGLLTMGAVLLNTLVCGAVMGQEAESTPLIKDPKHTWVFIVGVLKWQRTAGLKSFSEKDRRDLQLKQWFLEKGVPADHVVYLSDSDATLSRINEDLENMMEKTQPGDTLFSYYCGHGWVTNGKAYYGNYDAGNDPSSCLSVRKFVDTVATEFKGATAFFTADCCHSGAIGEELARAKPPFNYATVTSAVSAISSTGNWTFTQALLDCLSGHRYADTNSDGEITYEEFAKYVNAEMSSLERQKASANTSPDFAKDTVIGAVEFEDEAMPERAEVLWQEKWYPAKVLEKKDGQSKIRWVSIGWDTSASDEWVADSRVRKPPPADSEMPAASSKKWNIGDKVQVKWHEKWYPGVIKKYNDGQYYIHYTGYEDAYDEWVKWTAIK